MGVLRVYDPAECDPAGKPLDWERCRYCEGGSKTWRGDPCGVCDGHGSLKAAALHGSFALRDQFNAEYTRRYGKPDYDGMSPDELKESMARSGRAAAEAREAVHAQPRCEDCGHPMSEGTWEGPAAEVIGNGVTAEEIFDEWLAIERGELTARYNAVHYSPCDEGCRHGGPGRWKRPPRDPEWLSTPLLTMESGQTSATVEASWRQVDVRTLGWPMDLRPEKLAVLCLRCYAERAS